ncbi:MAG: M24 family metallopeptidase [Chlamydiia bacterium]|nr:M24 family metallopeptidase [Chlamydiia bacterium]
MKTEKLRKAQGCLKEIGADGWLLYDFHRSNDLAHLFLEISPQTMITRRFFYWIPVSGEPVRIVHAIEPHILDGWPGRTRIFLSWQSLQKEVKTALGHAKKIAMEYSPKNGNPYVSYVDGGTIDLIRSFGAEIVSSGAFLPHFTAVFSKEQGESHIRAAGTLDLIVRGVWHWIGKELREKKRVSEHDIQEKVVEGFEKNRLISDAKPIVAIDEHSADPHFETQKAGSKRVEVGSFILIDLWAKEREAGAVFGDITRVAVFGRAPTSKQAEVFRVVRKAQKAGIELVKRRFIEGKKVLGFEVDDAVREVVQEAGYGDYFLHRTGHSIERHVHGSGANLDNLEMHDDRPLLPGTCFSVEPGIYLPGAFGVRLESDVYIHHDGRVEVTGGEEDEIVTIS